MSLLMEALRKAEEDKKRAAQEQQHPQVQEGGTGAEGGEARAEIVAPEPGSSTDEIDTSRLSLEPIERDRPPAAAARAVPQSEPEIVLDDLHEATTRFDRSGIPASEVDELGETSDRPGPGPEAFGEPAVQDAESTMPSKKAVQSSVQEYFEASQSMERSRAGIAPAEAAAADIAATPVSAQTVFAAKNRRSGPRLLAIASVVVLLVAVGLGMVGFWYYTRTPAMRAPLSPLVVRDVEKSAAAPLQLPPVKPPAPAVEAPAPSAGQVAAVVAPAPPSEAAAPAAEAAEAAPAVASATPQPSPPKTGAEVAPPPAATVAATAAGPAPESAKPPAVAAASVRTETPATKPPTLSWSPPAGTGDGDVLPGQLQITRVPPQVRVNPKVEEAYSAYRDGHYNRAETLYREVLAGEPDQRDALFGMAALTARRGDPAGAAAFYERVLALDPHDRDALAALVSLRRQGDPVDDESRLKLMLADAPGSAYLNFMLGNTYARQSRWAAAQQAYFNAYSHESGNADYAFNLAVSLDHLGQRNAAMDYYRKALALADKQTTSFTASQVQARLHSLAGAVAGTPP